MTLVVIHCITQIKHKQLLIDQTGDFVQEKIQHLPVIILITFYSPSCLGQETAKGPYQESLLHTKSIVSFHITNKYFAHDEMEHKLLKLS